MANRPKVRQTEPEPLTAADVAAAVEALVAGAEPDEVAAALGAALRAIGADDSTVTARAIVRSAQRHAAHWRVELERGTHPETVTVLGMVMLELDNEMRAWAEDDADGKLEPIAATRAALVASLINPHGGQVRHSNGSFSGIDAREELDGTRPEPIRAVRMLQVLGASRSQAYALLAANDLPSDATDRDVPDDVLHAILSKLQRARARRLLDDRLTVPGRKRRSAYRMRQRRPDLHPGGVPPPRRRKSV